ncbi:hypothetical protein PI125_g23058 [Phytophthora idaei]|nr:hypothetical protein PI125_g23058 [Phytophthora idaei]
MPNLESSNMDARRAPAADPTNSRTKRSSGGGRCATTASSWIH